MGSPPWQSRRTAGPHPRDQRFRRRFPVHFNKALGNLGRNAGGGLEFASDRPLMALTIRFSVERDVLEDCIGAILAGVAEWNESYPTALAEYEPYNEDERYWEAAKEALFDADQQVIDRLMTPYLRGFCGGRVRSGDRLGKRHNKEHSAVWPTRYEKCQLQRGVREHR